MNENNITICTPVPVDNLIQVVSFDRALSRNARRRDISQNLDAFRAQFSGKPPVIDISSTCVNQSHYLFTLDWLTIRMTQNFNLSHFEQGFMDFDEYRLELLDNNGTKIFKNIANVYFREGKDSIGSGSIYVKVGQICFNSRLPTHNQTCTYKLENWVFYDSEMWQTNKVALTTGFMDAINSTYLGLSRVDIAVDGVDLDNFATDVLKHNVFHQLFRQNMCSLASSNEILSTNFRVGSNKGDKTCVYYNKTKEIHDRGYKKQYILDYFKSNGFDLSVDIKRFELRLKSSAIKTMKGFKISDLFNPQKLAEIVHFQLTGFFEFVESKHSDSRKSRRPRIRIFDFRNAVKQTYIRVDRVLLDGQRSPKIFVKQCLKKAYTNWNAAAYYYLKSAFETVETYRLEHWLTDNTNRFLGEFERLVTASLMPKGSLAHFSSNEISSKCHPWFFGCTDIMDLLKQANELPLTVFRTVYTYPDNAQYLSK